MPSLPVSSSPSRMFYDSFGKRVKTWNPVVGCAHMCTYCWAHKIALRLYGSFEPRLFEGRLSKIPKKGVVFVVSMGDLFCSAVPSEWIRKVLIASHRSNADLMFFTKNPLRYFAFLSLFPQRSYLGCTIESDLDDVVAKYSKAPLPSERIRLMTSLPWKKKVVSVEPVIKFSSPSTFAEKLINTGARLFYVGYDNHHNKLEEPSREEVLELIDLLKEAGAEVRPKTLR